jgi:hypothetical protein
MHLFDGLRDELEEYIPIDIVELVDVQAPLSHFVLSELRHQLLVFQPRSQIQHEALLAR